MKKWQSFLGIALVGMSLNSFAETVPLDSERWEFIGDNVEHRVEQYAGQQALYLKGGKAVVEDADFTNGVIEFDVLFTADFSISSTLPDNRAFVGSVFRVEDAENYEKFYMRPHRLPYEEDGAQYVPVYNDWSSWEIFWDGHITPVTYVHDEWMHIKLIISDMYIEVYITDMTTPILTSELKRPLQAGGVGVKVDPRPASAYAYFANFTYEKTDTPSLATTPPAPTTAPAGTVMTWSVSEPFAQGNLNNKDQVTEADRNSLSWMDLAADVSTGITNLAMAYKIRSVPPGGDDVINSVFVRTTIVSDRVQLKKFQFGFTDLAKVYFNGRLMYSEDNSFRIRNRNFMGTTGYFNELYLPLEAGENEVWIAVTGLLASWGVQGRLADLNGVTLSTAATRNLDGEDSGGDCTASYDLNGTLSIPCVAVPNGADPADGVTMFRVNMVETSVFNYISIFRVDPASIQLAE